MVLYFMCLLWYRYLKSHRNTVVVLSQSSWELASFSSCQNFVLFNRVMMLNLILGLKNTSCLSGILCYHVTWRVVTVIHCISRNILWAFYCHKFASRQTRENKFSTHFPKLISHKYLLTKICTFTVHAWFVSGCIKFCSYLALRWVTELHWLHTALR